jgi:hypothetical protein
MPTISKEELYERGLEVAAALCKANGWRAPVFKNNPRLRSTGLYTHNLVQVNVNDTAWLVNNPTVRRQSHPGWKTDRTAMGVVLHELGHHVWFLQRYDRETRITDPRPAWRGIHKTHQHERVSGYEPHHTESFAETFRLWALNPTLLKLACPERYRVLERTFGLLHPNPLPWRKVLPKTFHERASAWIAR